RRRAADRRRHEELVAARKPGHELRRRAAREIDLSRGGRANSLKREADAIDVRERRAVGRERGREDRDLWDVRGEALERLRRGRRRGPAKDDGDRCGGGEADRDRDDAEA